MPITTLDQLLAARIQKLAFQKNLTPNTTAWKDMWTGSPAAYPVPPAGGRAFHNGDVGTLPFAAPVAGQTSFLSGLRAMSGGQAILVLADRLVDYGGLDATLATAQATPHPALPRNVDGEDVEAWVEVFVTIGTPAQAFTVSYTNSQGVAGRTGNSLVALPSGSTATTMVPVTLAPGDTGVRSVESVTLAGATTVAGNFGIVLLRRLASLGLTPGVPERPFYERDWMALGLTPIPDTAALTLICGPATASATTVSGEFDVVQG